jgi:hypothetical protein
MAYKTGHDGQQRIMNHVAESMFELTDEEILAEVRESGVDPQEKADRINFVLRQAADVWECKNQRLSELGHTINLNRWRCLEGIYHNHCLKCGAAVSFTTTTGEMQGEASDEVCSSLDEYKTPRRQVSC